MQKEKNNHVLVKDSTLQMISKVREQMQKKSPYRITNDMVIRRLLEQSNN